ncbi:MAG: hypothetical protein ACLQNE_11075 [Thermoguttaceae bacterium]
MRLPESKIKQAILHPEAEIQEQALHYFPDVQSPDKSIMPLVIEAVEKCGRDKCVGFLHDAESLVQTEATMEWLMAELQRQSDLGSIDQDDYRYAVAVGLSGADPALVAPRELEIFTIRSFPEALCAHGCPGLRLPQSSRRVPHLLPVPQPQHGFRRFAGEGAGAVGADA